MKARRTPVIYYFVALALGLLAGLGLSKYSQSTRTDLMGTPWIVPALLFFLGAAILIMAIQVHRYAKGERRRLDSRFAVNVLLLSKSLSLACSALLGWYGAQALMCLGRMEAPYYANVVLRCSVTALICLVDVIIGIIGEWLCQLPPDDGPESPESKRNRRRRMVGAAGKTEDKGGQPFVRR